jgi:hypothetical protein
MMKISARSSALVCRRTWRRIAAPVTYAQIARAAVRQRLKWQRVVPARAKTVMTTRRAATT